MMTPEVQDNAILITEIVGIVPLAVGIGCWRTMIVKRREIKRNASTITICVKIQKATRTHKAILRRTHELQRLFPVHVESCRMMIQLRTIRFMSML